MLLGCLAGLAIWYLTPISDGIVGILLTQVPIEADQDLGRAFKAQDAKVHNTRWSPMLRSLGWQLVASSRNPNVKLYDWDFSVLDDGSGMVNAFAIPGGTIRVTLPLLDNLDLSEGEIAALVGHEMGHVVHRHSQQRIISQHLLSTVFNAVIYEDNDQYQESFGEAIGELLLKSADWLGQQSFSRANEYEADAFSWDLLMETQYFNPECLQSLLTKLWEYHGRVGGTTSWDSTHPGTLDRISALEEKWNELGQYEQQRLRSKVSCHK